MNPISFSFVRCTVQDLLDAGPLRSEGIDPQRPANGGIMGQRDPSKTRA